MSDDLDRKAKVALDLIDKGAEEVQIVGTDIKVVRKSEAQQSPGPTQIVNVHAEATASQSVNIKTQFSIIREKMNAHYKGNPRLPELQEKIDGLEKELRKQKPDKTSVTAKLKWMLDYGWDAFIAVAPSIVDKFLLA
jgi:glycogen debranching enzyme